MNSFSYFVLLLTVTFQAECKRHHKSGDAEFRRLSDQVKPPAFPPAQQVSSSNKLTTKPMVSFEVFKNKMKDTRKAVKPNIPGTLNLDKLIRNPKLWTNTQAVKVVPKQVPAETRQILKNAKQILATPKKQRFGKYQGLKDARQLLMGPKELDEEKKKAIKARYFQKEREDILDIERQKVEELKQKVLKMRTDIKKKNPKNKAKQIYLNNGGYEAKFKPLLPSNHGYQPMRKSAKRMRKRPKLSSATTKEMKSRFFVQTNTDNVTSTTSRSEEEPVMRGAERDFDDDDDDEDLNFDVEGEFLSHIVNKR